MDDYLKIIMEGVYPACPICGGEVEIKYFWPNEVIVAMGRATCWVCKVDFEQEVRWELEDEILKDPSDWINYFREVNRERIVSYLKPESKTE